MRTEQAIQMAMQSRWEEAAGLNREILAAYPDDVDAWNRLGKALMELGRYTEAREAYGKALELDRNNTIAKRNLQRLEGLTEAAPKPSEAAAKLTPRLFIEETGKTGVTTLQRPAAELLARMTPGDQVVLKPQDGSLAVTTTNGEYLGEVEARIGLRLMKLMEGGNQYAAALTAVTPEGAQVIIKEVYQHPSQAGRPSFPPAAVGAEGFRPYTKATLVRQHRAGEEEVPEEYEGAQDWEGDIEPDTEESDARLLGYQQSGEAEEDEEDADEYEE
ncbi:MAG TPA: tetratricopeptide repeat protein [Dehalococcoidia bacterium]